MKKKIKIINIEEINIGMIKTEIEIMIQMKNMKMIIIKIKDIEVEKNLLLYHVQEVIREKNLIKKEMLNIEEIKKIFQKNQKIQIHTLKNLLKKISIKIFYHI